MSISNSEIRAKARASLGGNIFDKNWLMALVVALIVSAISAVVAAVPALGTIASIIIAGPLSCGLALVFLKLARTGNEVNIEDTFDGFKDFSGNLLLGLMQSVYILLWTLLFIIPGIIKSYSYSMAFYIKNDHPEYDWNQCLTESRNMMDGYKWKLFCLQFSFIGWMIVGSLCFGIGTLWVSAYIETATAVFYNELKGEFVAEDNSAKTEEQFY